MPHDHFLSQPNEEPLALSSLLLTSAVLAKCLCQMMMSLRCLFICYLFLFNTHIFIVTYILIEKNDHSNSVMTIAYIIFMSNQII